MYLEHVQYHFHSFTIEPTNPVAKMLRKLSTCSFFTAVFTEYPVLLLYQTLFCLFFFPISQFSPCVIFLNNMFSCHSTPQISHNTLNSRDGSKYSIVFTWLDCGDFGLLLLPQIYVPKRVSHIIYQNIGPTHLMSLHVSTSCNIANST